MYPQGEEDLQINIQSNGFVEISGANNTKRVNFNFYNAENQHCRITRDIVDLKTAESADINPQGVYMSISDLVYLSIIDNSGRDLKELITNQTDLCSEEFFDKHVCLDEYISDLPKKETTTMVDTLLGSISNFFKEMEDYFDFEYGGYSFVDDSGKASGLQDLIRKGNASIEEVNVEGIIQAGIFAKGGKNPKAKVGKGTKVGVKVENWAVRVKSQYDAGKTIGSQTAGVTQKIVAVAEIVDKMVNKDTIVTAEFANDIYRTKGTAIIHTKKDSTVSIPKSQVFEFRKRALKSLEEQKRKVNKLLENNHDTTKK
jgi:hypothetical protein